MFIAHKIILEPIVYDMAFCTLNSFQSSLTRGGGKNYLQTPYIYYKFDASDANGTDLYNYGSSIIVYDASLSTTGLINTTTKKIGTGSLLLNGTSSQYISMNSYSDAIRGLSISCWINTTASSWQTICNFSDSSGNNSLTIGMDLSGYLYSTVVNGIPNASTITYGTVGNATTTAVKGMVGLAISDDGLVMVYANNYLDLGKPYYMTYNTSTSTWSSSTILGTDSALPSTSAHGCAINYNGTRIAFANDTGKTYFISRSSPSASFSTTFTQTLDTTGIVCFGLSMTPDGNKLVGCNDGIYYATWNGSNYTAYTKQTAIPNTWLSGVSITRDGSKIVYITWNVGNISYATWDGTQFANPINVYTTTATGRSICFSPDAMSIYFAYASVNGGILLWNGNTYVYKSAFPSTPVQLTGADNWGICVSPDGGTFYVAQYGNTIFNIWQVPVTINNISNIRKISTNPINNGSWHHLAITITNTGTHSYYIDNVLTNTFNSKLYPISSYALRTKNYIGKNLWFPNSSYNGYIDDFRLYKLVLSASDVTNLYNFVDLNYYTLFYYRFNSGDITGSTVSCYVSMNQVNATTATNGATITTTQNTYMVGTGALYLNGTTFLSNVPSFTNDANGLSIATWLYSINNASTPWVFSFETGLKSWSINMYLLTQVVNTVTYYYFKVEVYTVNGQFPNYVNKMIDTTNILQNTWYHFVWTMSSSHVWKFYINGALVITVSGTSTTAGAYPSIQNRTNTYNKIGKGDWGDAQWNGYIDDFRLYNTVLNDATVSNIYNSAVTSYVP